MERLDLRFKKLKKALETFKESIEYFQEIQEPETDSGSFEKKKLAISLRDSLVQRFEYSVDLFWKYLKLYLEEVEKTALERTSPRAIIRTCSSIKLLSENEAKTALEMLDHRNATSHIYREEIADILAKTTPEYYQFISGLLDRIKPPTT